MLPHRQAIAIGVLAGLAFAGSPAALEAQQVCRSMPPLDVARIMIPSLRSSDPGLAVAAADELRDRLGRDFNCRDLIVISRNDIFNTLSQSGYDTASALTPNDARLLGQMIRADEYVAGSIAAMPEGGYRADLNLALSRDPALSQPLPTITGRRLSDVARDASREIREARKQLDAERRCVAALRASQYQQAIQHAEQGNLAYPRATLTRLCKATAYSQLEYSPDSILAITNEILEIDPRSRIALRLAAEAYEKTGQDQRAVEAWTTLISLDPTNAGLIENATRYLVSSGNAAAAKPIIDEAVQQNPGDPQLQRLRWLVLLTIRDWRGAIAQGEDLSRTDTAITDTTFFRQLVTAYAADSQFQQAAEAAARGVAKFPGNATLHMLHAQNLRTTGQLQQAQAAVQRALEVDSRIQRGWVQLAQIQYDLGQPDSAMRSVHLALESGEDPAFIAQYATSLGGQMYSRAQSAQALEDWERVIPWFQFADSIQTSLQAPVPTTRFVLGYAAVNVAQPVLQQASDQRSCELAQKGRAMLNLAQVKLREGGSAQPEAAGQLLQWVMSAGPSADGLVRTHCR
ncbi:MAG TPA: hypothetical protein VMM18_09140 [Gemmatimonadaceae bacterium]|nr:hypothetical protein [Gemmatimonadaceae bacterium]